MMEWQPIETAPKDMKIRACRMIDGEIIFEQDAEFRRFRRSPIWDELRQEYFGGDVDEMAWMHPSDSENKEYKIPTPTHWKHLPPEGR